MFERLSTREQLPLPLVERYYSPMTRKSFVVIASVAVLTLVSACSGRVSVEEFAGGVAPVNTYVANWLTEWSDSRCTGDEIVNGNDVCLNLASDGFHTTINAELDLIALTSDDMDGYIGQPPRKLEELYADTNGEAKTAYEAAADYIEHCSSDLAEDCFVYVNAFVLEMERLSNQLQRWEPYL